MAKVYVLEKNVDWHDGDGFENMTVGIFDTADEANKFAEVEIAKATRRIQERGDTSVFFELYEWNTKTQDVDKVWLAHA